MKKFSLKKITAAVSAAAMIATMGTSAFASEITVTNDTITISDTDGDGIFDITVNYTSTVNNEIGVTMLTYGMSDDSDIAASTGYATTGMKIVGVDQSAGAVAKDGTGSFNFKVSAIKNSNGGYYLKRGVDAIIAVSGDGVPTGSTPTYNTIKLDPLTATSASFVDATSISVGYYNYDDENAKIDKIKTAITGKKVNVAAVGTAKDKENNPLESYTATYTLAGTEEVAKENDKYYVTIPNTATFDVDSVDASCIAIPTGGIKAEIPVTLSLDAWAGTGLALADGLSGITITKANVTNNNLDAAVIAELAKGNLVITGDNNRLAEVTNGTTDGVITVTKTSDGTYDAEAQTDQIFTYTVTVANAESVNEGKKVAELASGSIAGVSVTVKSLADGEFIIESVKALKGENEVTIPDQNFGADLQPVLNTALDGAEIWVYGTTDTEKEQWSLAAGEWTISGYDANVETEQTVTAKKAIVAPENNKGKNDNNKELSFTFKVLAKPTGVTYVRGDVTGDERVTTMDLTRLKAYLAGNRNYTENVEWLNKDSATFKGADINVNGKIDTTDLTRLKAYLAGSKKADKTIGQKFTD